LNRHLEIGGATSDSRANRPLQIANFISCVDIGAQKLELVGQFRHHAPAVVADFLSEEISASALSPLFKVDADLGGSDTPTAIAVQHLIEEFQERTGFSDIVEPLQLAAELCTQLLDGGTRQVKDWQDFAEATGCGPTPGGSACINAFKVK
jgi:hypothetical protein